MFLRHTKRKKDGKEHRYWSIVENRRIGGGRVVQRPLLYLGEINDSQELAWRKSIAILEEGALQPRTLSLFPQDRCEGLLPDASIVRLRLNELRLRRPRQWGGCWLTLSLWRELELDGFWGERLPPSRKSLPLRRQGVRGGTGCCACWRPTGCWRRAASGGCIANGLSAVPWPICSAKTSGWPKSTSCIAVTTDCSNTSRLCSIIWSGAGATCSTSASMCCSMRSLTKSSVVYRFSPVCSHHLLLRERRVRFPWSGVDKALFRVAACRVCRLLPAPFDGMLDGRTIVGLA